jgi:hypothetical protein
MSLIFLGESNQMKFNNTNHSDISIITLVLDTYGPVKLTGVTIARMKFLSIGLFQDTRLSLAAWEAMEDAYIKNSYLIETFHGRLGIRIE